MATVDGFAERLREALRGKNRRELASRSGVGFKTIDKYLSGETLPGLRALVGLAEALGVSITWLATGAGGGDSPVEVDHAAERTQREHLAMLQAQSRDFVDAGHMVMLPRLDVGASAGAGALVDSESLRDFVGFSESWLRARHITPESAHLLTAKGDSMEPTIRDGDSLIVDTSIRMAVDSAIYCVVFGGLLLVKRLFLLRKGGVVLSSDNKAVYPLDETIDASEVDQLHVAGRVMWFGRTI